MRRFYAVVVLCLMGFISPAQWKVATPTAGNLQDITFTDRYNGYAVFQATGIGNCMVTLSLYKTIDEGKNWIRLSTGTTNQIRAVHFVNQLTGWIAAASSEIRKTTDGGVTWTQQSTGVGSGYNDIWFVNANKGFVVGNNGLLRVSNNGGSSWTTIASGVTVTLRNIHFVNENLGFIGCSNGQVLRTTNGGTTWNAVTSGAATVNNVYFANDTHGFLVGGSNLYETNNGGQSWTQVDSPFSGVLLRLFFSSENVGYMVTDADGIYRTNDGGQTWTQTITPNDISDPWNAIHFVDDNTGYICGGVGRINKTTNGGETWVNMATGLGQELFTCFSPSKEIAYFGANGGKIYKTENGGISVFQQTALFPSVIQKLYFLNDEVGFACSANGAMLKTIDGGNNWIPKPTNTTTTLTDIHFINWNEGFASAGDGYIIKTIDNGETWDTLYTGFNTGYRGIWFTSADSGYVISHQYIYRTFNAGQTWTEFIPMENTLNPPLGGYASSLQDIVFTNPMLGYCAGTFGKILYTDDAGVTWKRTNAMTSNAEIEEMWFLNDSVGYFARLTSQHHTLDSCRTIGSMPTSCLANNWTTNSISMTNNANHGYCVGGLGGLIHVLETKEIVRSYTSTNAFCAGTPIFIAYHARGFYGAGAVFTAQLSNASGSFASPTNIGTYTIEHNNYSSGIITATIPASANGTGYRVRVVSSDGVTIGPDNGYDIVITPQIQPEITLASSADSICLGGTLQFETSTFGGGLNPAFQWYVNDVLQETNSNHYTTNTLSDGDVVKVSMQSSLGCAAPQMATSNLYVTNIVESILFDLGNDSTLCVGSSVQLNAPEGYTYQWLPSDGLSDSIIYNPIATIDTAITYVLTITSQDGCFGTDTISFGVFAIPELLMLTDTVACDGDSIQLTTSEGFSYQWSPADGLNNDTIYNPVATVTTDITYSLIITDENNCVYADDVFIQAVETPVLDLEESMSACLNSTVQLSAPTGYTYQWTSSYNIEDSTAQSIIVTVDSIMTYHLTVSLGSGCMASDSITVYALNLPTLEMQTDTSICTNSSLQLDAPEGYSYQWFPSQGLSDNTIQNPMALIVSDIVYHLTITDGNNCSATDSIAIYALSLPLLIMQADTAVCQLDLFQLNAPDGYVYQWMPSEGLIDSTEQNPTALITEDIIYYLIITDENNCSANDSISIISLELPVIVLSNDTSICVGECITLSAEQNVESIEWSPSEGMDDATSFTPQACINETTTFIAAGQDENGCIASAEVVVTVNALPDVPVITFESSTLTSTEAFAYQWYLDGEPIDGAQGISHNVIVDGDYYVEIVDENGCSNVSATMNVIISSVDEVDMTGAVRVFPNPASDQITIVFDSKQSKPSSMQLIDMLGHVVYRQEIDIRDVNIIQTMVLANGVYHLMITTNGTMKFVKVVVAK